MNLNTNTKRLTLTKTERGYLQKAKGVLNDLGRLGAGALASEAESAADSISTVEAMLGGTPEEVAVGAKPY